MSLHADAHTLLSAWVAPDRQQDELRQAFLGHLATHREAMLRSCRPDHLTGSALIVRGSKVLLVFHSKAGKWLQTGGHCEPGDRTLAATALREAREESGLDGLTIDPVPLRLSRHHVPFCGNGHHLDVQFLVHAPANATESVGEGADEVRWFGLGETADGPAAPDPTDQDVRDLIAAARTRLRESP